MNSNGCFRHIDWTLAVTFDYRFVGGNHRVDWVNWGVNNWIKGKSGYVFV